MLEAVFNYVKGLFSGFRGATFPKEPVLWMAFIAAVLNIGVAVLNGELSAFDGIESAVALLLGLIARGASTPVADPRDAEGNVLTP